jgi:ATP-binding cassette, subfamily C, bacterial CydC
MRKIISYIYRYKFQFAGAILLAVGTIVAGIGLMSSSGYLISRAAQRPMIVDLFMVTAAVRFFGISRAIVRYFERLVSHDLTFKILLNLRSQLYRQIDSFSHKWFMSRRPGDLLSGVTSDVETLQNVYLRIVSPVIVAGIISILTFSGLLLFDLKLAIVILLFFMVNGIFVPYFAASLAKGRGKKDVETKTGLKVFLVDRLQGVHDLLWMGQGKNTRQQFTTMQTDLDQVQNKNAGTAGLADGLNSLMTNLAMFSTLILAIPLVAGGELQGVMLAALTLGVLSSFEALQGLANAFIQYETSQEAAKRLFSIADSGKNSQRDENENNLSPLAEPHPYISFRNVFFSYDKEPTLNDISFQLSKGTKTAIVGPTGSGKSTIVNLMLNFWHPDQGQILAGNTDLRKLDPENYRSVFGVISQDSYIFNRSLRQNLLLANPDATDQQLAESLDAVGLGSFASNLDLEPGTHGMRFSGGERQLFAMARALLKESTLWVFDEPTAHMDANTERKILDAMWRLLQYRTLLFITHRLVDMEQMDQIIVMDKGKIAEMGTHEELLSLNQIYAKMFEQQNQVIRE